MCTAISFKGKDHYFGRTLDYEISYGEQVVITPRNYSVVFRKQESLNQHFAIIGMAAVVDDYPLYFDAINEKGLAMAGLNFPGNACYFRESAAKHNVTPFEFIPWILGQCDSVTDARRVLLKTNLIDKSFKKNLPLSPLHWMIADKKESITVESVAEGLKVYDNPVGVLTNNPSFEMQLFNLSNYMYLSPTSPKNTFLPELPLKTYSRGMGGMGLPGDLSSTSRFVRASFVKHHSICEEGEEGSVNQFFHILGAVEQQRGCVLTKSNQHEITRYTSCCNLEHGIYYYTTYENSRISVVELQNHNIMGNKLILYPLRIKSDFLYENR